VYAGHLFGNFSEVSAAALLGDDNDSGDRTTLRRALGLSATGGDESVLSSSSSSALVEAGLGVALDINSGNSVDDEAAGEEKKGDVSWCIASATVTVPPGGDGSSTSFSVSSERGLGKLAVVLAVPLSSSSSSAVPADQQALLQHVQSIASEASDALRAHYQRRLQRLRVSVREKVAAAILSVNLDVAEGQAHTAGAVTVLSRWITSLEFGDMLGACPGAALLLPVAHAASLSLCNTRRSENSEGEAYVEVASGSRGQADKSLTCARSSSGNKDSSVSNRRASSTPSAWERDLRAGHVVQFDFTGGGDDDDGSGDRESADLRALVRCFRPRALTGCVVPAALAGTTGVNALVIVVHSRTAGTGAQEEEEESEGNEEKKNNKEGAVAGRLLSPEDVCCVYEEARLGALVAGALRTATLLHRGQLSQLDQHRITEREDILTQTFVRNMERRIMRNVLGAWKLFRQKHALRTHSMQMDAVMDMLQLPFEDPAGTDSASDDEGPEELTAAQKVISRVEEHACTIFPSPDCNVNSALGAMDIPDALLHAPRDCYVARTTSGDGPRSRAVLMGVVRDESGNGKVLGWVKVMKGSALPATFNALDVRSLSHLCEVCSTAYAAMKTGLEAPRLPGNVNALLLPALTRAMPMLLGASDASATAGSGAGQQQLSSQSPLHALSLLFKYICGGDVALLRLKRSPQLGGGSTSSSNATDDLEDGEEQYVSSEDPTASKEDFASVFSGDERYMAALDGRLVDLSAPTAASSRDDGDGDGDGDGSAEQRFQTIALKLRDVHGREQGEIKILGPMESMGFTLQQRHAARVLSYMLSGLMAASAKQSSLRGQLSRANEATDTVSRQLALTKDSLSVEAAASQATRARLGGALALTVFATGLREVRTLQELSSYVHSSLPAVLGVRGAMLLLRPDLADAAAGRTSTDSDANFDEQQQDAGLCIISASSATASAVTGDAFMSYRRLATVAAFPIAPGSAAPDSRSKILLQDTQTEAQAHMPAPLPFGALVLLPAPESVGSRDEQDSGRGGASQQWTGLEDVLSKAVGDAILGCVRYLASHTSALKLTNQLAESKALVADFDTMHRGLTEQLATESALLREEQGTRAALEVTVTSLTAECEIKDRALSTAVDVKASLVRDRDDAFDRFREKISLLEAANHQRLAELQSSTAHAKGLEMMVGGFAGDQRAHKDTAGQWLQEFTEGRKVVVLTVAQATDGTLSGAEDVRGVLSAAGEALRTASTIEIQTYYTPSGDAAAEPHTGVDGSVEEHDRTVSLRRHREQWARLRQDGDRATVLVVPNRCITSTSRHDNACYLFIKPAEDKSTRFSKSETVHFTCAADLVARALLRASSKYSFDDMRRMELSLQQDRAALAKVRHSLVVGDRLRSKECTTSSELQRELEAGAVGLLDRGGDNDICAVHAYLWYLPSDFSLATSTTSEDGAMAGTMSIAAIYSTLHADRQHHVAGDLEAMKTIFTHEPPRPVSKAGMLWCPLLDATGKIVALLRVERRLSADLPPQHQSHRAAATGANALYPRVEDIVISSEETEAVHALCRQASGQYSRIMALTEAKSSIDEAGAAISTLQGQNKTLEGAREKEEAVRSTVQLALDAGAELMGAACAKRLGADQLIDATRKAMRAVVAGCDECYVVLPSIKDVFPSPNFAGGDLLAIANSGLPVEGNGMDNEDFSWSDHKYYTIESDVSRPLRVDFQRGDVELASLMAYRSLATGSTSSPEGEEEGLPAHGNGHASASWAVRRLFSRASRPNDAMEGYHATAIPFTLLSVHDGSKFDQPQAQAVIAAVRKARALSRTERECVAYLARVFTYCLEMWVGKGSVNEALSRIERLNHEVERLRFIQRGAQEAEVDTSLLQQDLCSVVRATAELPTESSPEQHAQAAVAASLSGAGGGESKQNRVRWDGLEGSDGPNSEEEATQVVLASAREVFLHLTCEQHSPSEAGIAIGSLVPCRDSGNEVDGSSSGSGDAGSAFRGVVKVTDGQCSYWVGRSGTNRGPAYIYMYLAHSAYPTCWMSVSGFEQWTPSRAMGNTALRVAMLLKLLSAQVSWRQQLFAALAEVQRIQGLYRTLEETSAEQFHQNTADTYKMVTQHKQDSAFAASLQADAETALAASNHVAQSFFSAALALARSVVVTTEEIEGVGTVAATEACAVLNASSPWLLERITRITKAVSAASGWQATHGLLTAPHDASSSSSDSSNLANLAEVVGLSVEFEEDGMSWSFSRREVAAMRLHNIVATLSAPAEEPRGLLVLVVGSAIPAVRREARRARRALRGLREGGPSLPEADAAAPSNAIGDDDDEEEEGDLDDADEDNEEEDMGDVETEDAYGESIRSTRVITTPAFSAAYPAGSLLIPVRGRMLVLRPPAHVSVALDNSASPVAGVSNSKTTVRAAASSLRAVLLGACGLARGIEEGLSQFAAVRELNRSHLHTKDNLAVTTTDLEHASQQVGNLSALRDRLQSRLETASARVEFLQSCHVQNLRYAQRLADHAELTRGINRSCTNVAAGVLPAWSQASKLLMSLLASHVVLRGCGLCLPRETLSNPDGTDTAGGDGDNAAVEYTCRGYDGSEIMPVADAYEVEANVYARPLHELGDAVEAQVKRLLFEDKAYSGIFSTGGGSSRAVYCMSGGGDEHVWLVPVRTSRAILGVLRVHVSLRSSNSNNATNASRNGEEDDDDEDEKGENVEERRTKMPGTPAAAAAPAVPAPTPTARINRSSLRIRFTPDTKLTPTKTEVVTPRADPGVAPILSGNYDAAAETESTPVPRSAPPMPGSEISAVSESDAMSTHGRALLADADEAIDSAQSSLLHFSDMFAPVLLSAAEIEESRVEARRDRANQERQRAIATAAQSDSSRREECMGMLERCLHVVDAFEKSVKPATGGRTDADNYDNIPQLRPNARLPLQQLVDKLGGVLGGTVNLILRDAPSLYITEGDSAFATVSRAGSGGSQGDGDQTGTMVSGHLTMPGGSSNSDLLGRLNVTVRGEEDHVAAVKFALTPLTAAVCAAVCGLARERVAVIAHVSAVKDISRLSDSLQEQVERTGCENALKLRALALSRHYEGLSSIAGTCMAYVSSLARRADKIATGATTGASTGADAPGAAELSTLLPNLCSRIPAMVGLPCAVSIAVAEDAVPVSGSLNDRMHLSQGLRNSLQWYRATGGGTANSSNSLAMLTTDDARSMAENVARSCVARGARSNVRVAVEDTMGRTGGRSMDVILLSFPLEPQAAQGQDDTDKVSPLGVLQLAVLQSDIPTAAADSNEGGSSNDEDGTDNDNVMELVEEFCAGAAAAAATAVLNYHASGAVTGAVTLLGEEVVSRRNRGDEMESFSHMWQRRADAWGGVAAAASAILRHSAAGSVSFLDILSSEAVAGALRGSGVNLAVIKGSASDPALRQRTVLLSGSSTTEVAGSSATAGVRRGRVVSASDFVTLDEDQDITVEVYCEGFSEDASVNAAGLTMDGLLDPSAGGGGAASFVSAEVSIAPIASDLVHALTTVIRSCVTTFRARTMERSELTRSNEILSTGLHDAEHALALATASAMEQKAQHESQLRRVNRTVEECEKLATAATHSMAAFCGPTIREISVMLEELGTDRRPVLTSVSDAAKSTVLDWAWEGIARVADRAMNRVSNGEFSYHVSILVQVPRSYSKKDSSSSVETDLHLRMFDMSRRKESFVVTSNRGPRASKVGILSDPSASTLEKALMAGGVHENKNSQSHTDLAGIEKQVLSAIFDSSDPHSKVTVACIALPDAPVGVNAILRVVFPSLAVKPSSSGGGSSEGAVETDASDSNVNVGGDATAREELVGPRSLAKHVLEMTMSLGCAVIHICHHLSTQDVTVATATASQQQAEAAVERMQGLLDDSKKMHRVVCREACALLDPPLVGPGGQAPRAVHPASLTPLAASQDSCMKVLSMARTLLRGEGQALLLRDTTSDPVSYQVIYSGNGIGFAGIEQGSFGNVTAGHSASTSLVNAAMHTHKPVLVDDAAQDSRYNDQIDGSVAANTPMCFIPIRGRGSSVVGALIVARGRDGEAFTAEDLAVGEIAVSHGALSLYWCQGLGALHHVLNKSVTRLQELESAVVSLRR
jgi:hypothetical protein